MTGTPTAGVVIEAASPSDAEAMARLHHRSHVESFAPFVPAEWIATRDVEAYRERWHRTLERLDRRNGAWVARLDGEVVGIVQVYEVENGWAELASMHVVPGMTGAGIGTALMNVAMQFIRDAEYTKARLGVIAANKRARRFYEKFGWRECHYLEVGVEGEAVYHYCVELSGEK